MRSFREIVHCAILNTLQFAFYCALMVNAGPVAPTHRGWRLPTRGIEPIHRLGEGIVPGQSGELEIGYVDRWVDGVDARIALEDH